MGENKTMEVMKCFVKAIKESFETKTCEVAYTKWYWKAIQNQWSSVVPRYVCKFGLYALSMETLSGCLARAIPKYLDNIRLTILEVIGDQSF